MNYDYSNLVNLYYDEAKRCLEAGCAFAAISMFWSTVDYAVEYELRGGSKVHNNTSTPLRQSIKYKAMSIKDKLEALFGLFPKLQQYKESLLRLYAYRNTYLHAKLSDVVHEPVSEIELGSAISLQSKSYDMKFERPLGASWLVAGEKRTESSPGEQEVYLIGTAPIIAIECRQLADDFLDALGREVRLQSCPT